MSAETAITHSSRRLEPSAAQPWQRWSTGAGGCPFEPGDGQLQYDQRDLRLLAQSTQSHTTKSAPRGTACARFILSLGEAWRVMAGTHW